MPQAAEHPDPARAATDSDAFYSSLYDRLYRWGYHKDTGYSHSRPLCDRLLDRCAFDSVLDIGCSHGWAVEYLASKGKHAVGIDVSTTAVKAGQRLGRNIRLGSATAIPLPDASVDAVISTDCFEHLRPQDVDKAIDETLRVARRFIALKVNPRADRNGWWKLIAGTNLHLTLMPIRIWTQQYTLRGCSMITLDEAAEEFIVAKPV